MNKGTSRILVEKFPSAAAYRSAREAVRAAYKERPAEFVQPELYYQPVGLRGRLFDVQRPSEAFGLWACRDIVAGQIERVYAIEGQTLTGAQVLRARVTRNLRRWADSFREWALLDALLSCGDLVLAEGNILLNEGINEAWNLICAGGSPASYNNANARVGTGTGSGAAAATDTGLTAGVFKAMDATFPTSGTSQKATFKGTFGTADANQAWAEWSVDNGNTANKNLNRKVESLGTKSSGTTWTLTADITLS